jgi:tetratricopeptide (TPR) repeat protein
VALFETRFSSSSRRARLNATLVATYAAYGVSDAVIDRGRRFLATFPDAPERSAVALTMADAFARKDQVAEEFAAYDALLQELAARADRVPLGAGTGQTEPSREAQPAGARSQEYARVLDRYIARLVSRRQLPDALAVYRREIDRNPNDPGLYAAAAQFLEQNNVAAEVEQIYRLAIQQFPDPSWHHRLARWYLRGRQSAAFETLTRDITRTFEGSDLARYFQAVVGRGPAVNGQLFLQLNLYAHERFPHHLIFVNNLLSAYATRGTVDPAAREALLRRHWFEDEALATEFSRCSRAPTASTRRSPECAASAVRRMRRTGAAWRKSIRWRRPSRGGRHLALALRVGDADRQRAGGRVSVRCRAESASRLAAPVLVMPTRAEQTPRPRPSLDSTNTIRAAQSC